MQSRNKNLMARGKELLSPEPKKASNITPVMSRHIHTHTVRTGIATIEKLRC